MSQKVDLGLRVKLTKGIQQKNESKGLLQDRTDSIRASSLIFNALEKNKKSKLTAFECLALEAGFTIHKDTYLILNKSDHSVSAFDVMEYYGFDYQSLRCPVCSEPLRAEELFFHLGQKYNHGHSLPIKKIIKFFRTE